MRVERDGIRQIDTDKLYEHVEQIRSGQNNEEVVLLDVREEHEYLAGHIPGVHLLPVSQFMARYEHELRPEKKYIVICRSGGRSQMVCLFLREQGFKHCVNYAPGMLSWFGPLETGPCPTTDQEKQ